MSFWLIIVWTLVSLIFGYFKIKYTYWERMDVKQLKTHFLWGNLAKMNTLHHTELLQEVYDAFKTNAKLAGSYIFTKPIAVISDLDLVKTVLIKDFNKFASRMNYKNEKDILSQHLFNLEATAWRPLRQKFTPTFTSMKMKYMFPSIKKVTCELTQAYDECLEKSSILNILHLNARFTTDVIATCILGIECNSLRDPSAEFHQISTKIFGRTNMNVRWHLFKQTYPQLMKYIGFKRFPRCLEDYFRRIVRESYMEREKHEIFRKDFVDILLEMKKNSNLNLSYDQIAAQFFIFYVAGFETSATTMSNALFELARNEEKQAILRQEIMDVLQKYDNEVSYEAMKEMKYLDQVISETLRLYPILSFLQRVATEDYSVPDTDITLHKGTAVFIPIWAIHHDPEIYENPQQFLPERFHPAEVAKRHPQAFLGFGDGPRNCIGLRFGSMQVKLGLIALLTKYSFAHCSATKEIFYSNHNMIRSPTRDICLQVKKL